MAVEHVVAFVIMIGLAVLLGSVGWAGRAGRLTYALGGWTAESATPESWRVAHQVIGTAFVAAAGVAVATAVVALAVPVGAVGPVVVAGSIVLLVPTIVGVVVGVGRLRAR